MRPGRSGPCKTRPYGSAVEIEQVRAELAPQAGLQPGTARSYLYAELDGRKP
jgi:hypothetical protein